MATTSWVIEFLDFLQTTITMFYMSIPSESVGAEYLWQTVMLHPLQEILQADYYVTGVITLQAMQVG